MDTAPNFELIKDAYAIIDGIPETAIDLDKLVSRRGETLEHGTVCSPAGWLAQHPRFVELGLTLADDDIALQLAGEPPMDEPPAVILSRIFGLAPGDAEHLFSNRQAYTLGDDSGLSDKRLWLREVREFLKQHGHLDAELDDHLETRGPFADPSNPSEIRAL